MNILFGNDIDSTRMTVKIRPHANAEYRWQECSLSDGIDETFLQVFDTIGTRLTNPLWNLLYKLTGKCYGFTRDEKINDENCRIARDTMRDYIRKRQSG